MRLAGSGEHAMAANAGLPQVALALLGPITEKYVPRLISHADLWALAANVSIKAMGGPDVRSALGTSFYFSLPGFKKIIVWEP